MPKTQIRRIEQYKDRWTSFGENTGISNLSEKPSPEELKQIKIFQSYDDNFLERISPDISIALWREGAVLFEEGSYIDMAFYIVKGHINVFIQQQDKKKLNRPIFDSGMLNKYAEAPESERPLGPSPLDEERRSAAEQTVYQTQIIKQLSSKAPITFLNTMDFNLPFGGELMLGPGEFFGEIGALVGWPQSVTAQTASECTLVQIRIPALRMLRNKSKELKEYLDKHYRETALFSQLKTTPLFRFCDDGFVNRLKEKVELVSCKPEEIFTCEGEQADALYLVRSGFVKLSQKLADGEIVVSYLSKGMTFGEIELLIEGMNKWYFTASSVENTELVKISREDFLDLVTQYPIAQELLWKTATERIKEAGYTKRNLEKSDFINTALNTGLVEGNSILVIDLNVCTRCDDCVRGCADTHGGTPKFVREGDKFQNFLVTRACYHCQDPVCLIGCPTGAIRRAAVGDVVEIVDELCIGCQTCARNCPYDAITMHETGIKWPMDTIPQSLRGKNRMLATKCDLCYNLDHGPACVSNCPHGCAIRVNNVEGFNQLLGEQE